MTLAHSHDLGCLGDGKLVFQNTVENLNPCLFLLVQRYIPHGDDIFADQLADDRIVEHQHFATGFSSHPFSYGERGFTAMAVNRAVSSHAGRVDFTRAGAPDSAIMR